MERLRGDTSIGGPLYERPFFTTDPQRIHSGLTCGDITDRASEYLNDRFPILTKVRFGLHLASCARCRTYVKQIDLVSSALRNLPKRYPSPVNRLRLRQ